MTAGGADAGDPPATVVVPTRDRPHALARCLAALRDQVCIALGVVVLGFTAEQVILKLLLVDVFNLGFFRKLVAVVGLGSELHLTLR